ncbi:hypothetical protein Taro_011678 [Colocasia esculenta]|uniref:Uncharacterized protein n=1 Tax=Colocasia esculenta TaxID=4460 RepID=A0A843UDD7_COLES|nr:hypothetical protein [Colocasia esculenta]
MVVVEKNFRLRVDEDQMMEKLESWMDRLQLRSLIIAVDRYCSNLVSRTMMLLENWGCRQAIPRCRQAALSVDSVQPWTPTLIPASSDLDVNFSGLHAQQSCKLLKQGMATIGGMPPMALRLSKRHDVSRRQGPWTPSSSLESIDHAADSESAARDRRLVLLNRTPWLPVDDVEVCQLATTSRGVRSRQSSRPRPHRALCFPHHCQWTMEYSCKVWCKPCRRRPTPRQHSRPSWRPRLVAFDHRTLDEALSAACRQEGEMEQYLEEKKASQKRPAATFQRQDKRKTVYQTPQKQVAVSNYLVPSVRSPGAKKECPYCGKTHGGIVGDTVPSEEAAETDSERGD